MTKILRYIVLAGIFLIPAIPLVVTSSMFFPFITGKNFAFRMITEAVFAAWLILAVRDSRYRPKFSWIAASVAGFLGITILADAFGIDFARSFGSNFERMEGLITHLHLFAYFLIVSSVLNSEKLWSRLAHTSLGVSVILAVYSALQLMGAAPISQSSVRIDGRFGNSTYFAVYILFHVFLALFLFLRESGKSSPRRFVLAGYGAIIVVHSFLLIDTASRGVTLGLILGLGIAALIIALLERERRFLKRSMAGIALGLLVVVGGFIALRDLEFVGRSPILSRFANISLSEGQSRFMVWNMAWQGFLERPILGWGEGNFYAVFDKYYNPGMYTQEPWFDRAHNVFFDRLIAGGVLGLSSYLLIFAVFLLYVWKDPNGRFSLSEKAALTGLMSGYFFQNLFVFDNVTSYLLFFSFLAYAHFSEGRETSGSLWKKVELNRAFSERIFPPVLVISVIFVFYFANAKQIIAARSLIRALMAQDSGLEGNLSAYKRALGASALFGRTEVREQLAQFAIQAASSELPQEFKNRVFDLTEEEVKEEARIKPLSARAHFFAGIFFRSVGNFDEAEFYFSKALELSPKKQRLLFELGAVLNVKGDLERSFELFRRAYELDTSYDEARILAAASAIYAGERDYAEEILLSRYGTLAVDDPRLLKAYVDDGQFGRALDIWKKRAEANPDNPTVHLSLGAAYFRTGDRSAAIREIEKAVKLNPNLKSEAENLLREMGV